MSERKRLSNEEKLKLMQEYMRETGKKIKADTEYKGYNIGTFRNNLRQAYFKGTLKMEESLLKQFEESGILPKEKERKARTTQQEKYNFLMQMAGKKEEELSNAKMESGLAFVDVKHQIQADYNRGKLGLTAEQIENLKKNGFLNHSSEEREELAKKYGIPAKYVIDILERYGSYETFLEKYKTGEANYDFQGEIFCGYRGITLSEKDITEAQKLSYANLVERIRGKSYKKEPLYIDVDKLEISLTEYLTELENQVIQLRFGLKGQKYSLEECRKTLNLSCERIRQIEAKAIRKMKNPKRMNQFVGNIDNDKIRLEKCGVEVESTEKYIDALNKIKEFIEGADEEARKNIGATSLETLGITGITFTNEISENKTIQDLIEIAENEKKAEANKLLETPVEYLSISVRAYGTLKREGIHTVRDITKLSETDLDRISNLGPKAKEEIISTMASLGLKMREDDLEASEENHEATISTTLEMCEKRLAEYTSKRDELKQEIEELKKKIKRYDIAYQNYLTTENLFDPSAAVPAVAEIVAQVEENTVEEEKTEDILMAETSTETVTQPKEEQVEEKQEQQEQLKEQLDESSRKEILLASIREGQKQLEELKQMLAKIGLGEENLLQG